MSEPTIESLTARIARLEQSNNPALRWIVAGLAFSVVILIFVALAPQRLSPPPNQKTVAAEGFMLRNAAGDNVALFSAGTDGTPGFALFDAEKKIRLLIGLRPNGSPYLWMVDPQQVARATLALDDQQVPSMILNDAKKLPRAVFGLTADGAGTVQLNSGAGGLNLSGTTGAVRWNPAGAPAQDLPVQK
jgi:hypothetical protein